MLYIEYKTGLAIEPPVGYHIEIVARSSVSKTDLILANCLAVGDQGYRGEYRLRFKVPIISNRIIWAENEEKAIRTFEREFTLSKVKKYITDIVITIVMIQINTIVHVLSLMFIHSPNKKKGLFGTF